jgi:uncharacterized protein (UPF0333 family)
MKTRGKTIYVIVINDKREDTDVLLFSSADEAINKAKDIVQENARYPEDINETLTESMKEDGWIYCGQYSYGGDHVFVMPRNIA